MNKIKFYFDYEKEEKWINEMCKAGWHLKKFRGCLFTFERGEPGAYVYRNEFINYFKKDKKQYFGFLKESDIEIVHVFGNAAYYRKKTEDGPFELYSDNSSRLSYLNRLYITLQLLFWLNILSAISNLSLNDRPVNDFISGVNTGVALVLLIPLFITFSKRNKLKKKQLLHE